MIDLELKKRVMTGVGGGAMLLAMIIWGGTLGIFFLTTLLSLGMLYEFTEMTLTLPDRIEKRYFLLSLGWFLGILNLLAPQSEFALWVGSFLILFVYFLGTVNRHAVSDYSVHFKELMFSIFGLSYLVFLPFYLRRIYELANGVQWVILFLFIVWMGDSGAYFVGKKYGRHKLYPAVSPRKTVEGAGGGLLASFCVTVLFKLCFLNSLSWVGVLFLPVLVGGVAQVGDLCESFLKRAFERKDSGSILPGHGGILDRFDSVVFSLPAMYACIRIFS